MHELSGSIKEDGSTEYIEISETKKIVGDVFVQRRELGMWYVGTETIVVIQPMVSEE